MGEPLIPTSVIPPGDELSEIYGIDHVQVAIPAGEEETARKFYGEVLGLQEEPKPAHLAKRGGLWLRSGGLRLHLGIDEEFVPAQKAHPAFLVHDLHRLVVRCQAAGYQAIEDEPLEGYDRVYFNDPFGNRLEFMKKKAANS